MDREILTYAAITIVVLTVIGGFYLGPASTPSGDALHLGERAAAAQGAGAVVEAPTGVNESGQDVATNGMSYSSGATYDPEDIRYKFQQEAAKHPNRRQAVVSEDAPPEEPSENEEPPIDEPVEEPPIE